MICFYQFVPSQTSDTLAQAVLAVWVHQALVLANVPGKTLDGFHSLGIIVGKVTRVPGIDISARVV